MRTLPIRIFGSCFIVSLCLLLIGCLSPNVRILASDAVEARCYPSRSSLYSQINIDLQKLPHELRVRLQDGKIVTTSEITLENIWPHTWRGRLGNPLPADAKHGVKIYDALLDCSFWSGSGGYGFEFENGVFVGLGVGLTNPKAEMDCRPAIGSPTKLYVLPLSEEQLVDLFGPFQSVHEAHE